MFTSSKPRESRNLDTLYQYINHRLYNFRFTNKPQIVEKDQLFIPAGFDSLNLIRTLGKGHILTQGSSYEDVLRPQFTAMANSKQFGKSSQLAQQQEVFLESEDWQNLLSIKFKGQEVQASATKEKDPAGPSAGSATKPVAKPRDSVLGQVGAQSSTIRQSVIKGGETKPGAGAGPAASGAGEEGKNAGKAADSGQAYFVKLLKSKQYQDTKKRRSTLLAAEQAKNLVNRVQQQMDEGTVGDQKQAPEDDDSSSNSEEADDQTQAQTLTNSAA